MTQGQIAMPAKTTIVQLSGTLEDGTVITQDVPVPHADGTPSVAILTYAFNVLKSIGGLLVDVEGGGMQFYLGSKFIGPITLSIKNVVLAGADQRILSQ